MFLERLFANRRQKAPTRQQWFSKIENLERLRSILTDPVFVAACNHLLDSRRIGESALLANPKALKLAAAFTAGHAAFLTDLERLTLLPVERPTDPEPFSHITADPYE